LSVLEICAGAGGQSLGLERAGFHHAAAIDIDADACATLRLNRPGWNVIRADIAHIDGSHFRGVDLLAGGIPCPPFSIAGKQLGHQDERDLFPQALRIVEEVRPAAVMIENVRGLGSARFRDYRLSVLRRLVALGYQPYWNMLNACDYGVPQLRPRLVLAAVLEQYAHRFSWPPKMGRPPTVGAVLIDLMASRGWPGAEKWAREAAGIAPTIVGGSRKHGGPDLGPTRARQQWLRLRVDGKGIADMPPPADFPVHGYPRLTVRMVARLQGFPDGWAFTGSKTAAYRQVGNAFPPPVAFAVGAAIRRCLDGKEPPPAVQLPFSVFASHI